MRPSGRDYAILYPFRDRAGGSALSAGAFGGNTTTPSGGVHALDGPDHSGSLPAARVSGVELHNEGGQSLIDDHGAAGSTEDIDPTAGNVHTLTLDDDLTATLLAPVGAGAATIELWVTQDGTGGHELTLAADGGSVTGDISAHTTTAGETFRVIAERIPGTTNDWVVDLVGGAGGSGPGGGATAEDPNIWRPLMDGDGDVVTAGEGGEAVMVFGAA